MRPCAVLLLLVVALAGCESGNHSGSRTSGGSAAAAVSVPAAEHGECAQLYASLQRVTLALQSSSELLTNSQNKEQLSQQIAVEQDQLSHSAQLVEGSSAPGALSDAKRRLVTALRAFGADFGRAKVPAARGDFQAAVAAMTDRRVVHEIVSAAATIEKACK